MRDFTASIRHLPPGGIHLQQLLSNMRALCEEMRMLTGITAAYGTKDQSESVLFGRGQIIWRNEEGVLCGASEPRADGVVAAW